MDYKIFIIPFISALIGWFTNYLAVRMIFRPYNQKSLGFIKIQGLIPKRKGDLAESIGKTVSTHLISHQDIVTSIKNTNMDLSFESIIDKKLEELIETKLFSFNPLVATFINTEKRGKIKEAILKQIITVLPELAEEFANNFEKSIDLRVLVTERIKEFDLPKLEGIILDIASRELKAIELYGGALGFIIGLIQVLIIMI